MNEIETLIQNVFITKPAISIINDDKLDILLSDKKKESKSVYLSQIRKFIKFSGDKVIYDKWDIRRYIAYLREQDYSSNYIKTVWYALKLFFESRDLPWDFRRGDVPKLERDEVKKIVMSLEDVKKLIEYTKRSGFDDEKVIIALSTTYGLRRSEISSLKNENINSDTIFVKTKKHGEARKHLIPSEIDFIKGFNFDKKMPSVSTANTIFNSLCSGAKIKRERGGNIHSIRRFLVVYLTGAEVPELMMKNYLRWRVRGDIAQEYYRPDFREIDSKIFKTLEPILSLWR